MITIYLIRHGETAWNKEGRYQGITDVALNETGKAQAKACGQAMKEVPIDKIISSDLCRARYTAEAVRGDRDLEIQIDPRLRELNFGDWETKTFDQIESTWPGLIDQIYRRPDPVKVPHGESFQELQDRAWAAVKDVIDECEDGQTLLVVAHGGTLRTIICKLLHLPISYCWNFSQGNTCINRIFYNGMDENDHNILNLLNDTKHVDELNNEM